MSLSDEFNGNNNNKELPERIETKLRPLIYEVFETYYKDTFGKRVRSRVSAETARQFLIAKDSSKSFEKS